MHETPEDLAALQALLDRSHEQGGPHYRSIVTDERRLTAEQIVERLQGMCLVVVATVTADGRPITGPYDGVFYRGAFHFGSSPESVRFRHLRQRPQVSVTHLPGEHLCVTVHGRAEFLDMAAPDQEGFRQALRDIYSPRYGDEWLESMLREGAAYVRVQADRIVTFNGEGL